MWRRAAANGAERRRAERSAESRTACNKMACLKQLNSVWQCVYYLASTQSQFRNSELFIKWALLKGASRWILKQKVTVQQRGCFIQFICHHIYILNWHYASCIVVWTNRVYWIVYWIVFWIDNIQNELQDDLPSRPYCACRMPVFQPAESCFVCVQHSIGYCGSFRWEKHSLVELDKIVLKILCRNPRID